MTTQNDHVIEKMLFLTIQIGYLRAENLDSPKEEIFIKRPANILKKKNL